MNERFKTKWVPLVDAVRKERQGTKDRKFIKGGGMVEDPSEQ